MQCAHGVERRACVPGQGINVDLCFLLSVRSREAEGSSEPPGEFLCPKLNEQKPQCICVWQVKGLLPKLTILCGVCFGEELRVTL